MMPPPNVTAVLHMGHGLNNTVQDVLVRFERMRGREALWLPGTDHAGIATQNVVERQLAKEGQTRFDLGRERSWSGSGRHVDETGGAILEQLKAIGVELRLDPHLLHARRRRSPRAVREVVRAAVREGPDLSRQLHHQLVPALPHGALQRGGGEGGGGRDASGTSAIRSPDGSGYVTVATTRPETMLGDTARGGASRRRALRGAGRARRCCCRWWTATFPIVADDAIDPDVRHRRGEGDAGARPERLRDRPAARTCDASTS